MRCGPSWAAVTAGTQPHPGSRHRADHYFPPTVTTARETAGHHPHARPYAGPRPSYGVDSTIVVRCVTPATDRIWCNNRSNATGEATRTFNR